MSDTVGLRELRQQASDIVRRIEEGQEVVVTVAGRPAARIVPVGKQRWRTGRELALLFSTPVDPAWQQEHAERSDVIDGSLRDPWHHQE